MYHIFVDNNEIIAFTTDREGGYSTGPYRSLNLAFHVGDDHNMVLKNHYKLADELHYGYQNLYFTQQTHGTNLEQITEDSPQVSDDTDALYTKETNKYIGVMTADCLPILGYDPTNHLVFAIHAGWLGSVKMITHKTLNYLIENEKLDVADTQIYLGPSISQKNYQVQDDVYQKVMATPFDNLAECFTKNDDGTYQFNNRLYNIKQLESLGIKAQNITELDDCTYENEKYFSYRRDGQTGRMMSIIALKNS